MLESRVLSTEDFQTFAKDQVLFCHVTTRLEGREGDDLLGKKGGTGFPYVVAMDAEGRVLSRLAQRTVEGFETMLTAARESLASRANPEITTAERIEFLVFDLSVGNVDVAAARESMAAMKDLTDAQRKTVGGAIANGETRAILSGIKGSEEIPEAGRAYHEMAKAGRVPTDPRLVRYFWFFQLGYAETLGDVEIFKSALEKIREQVATHPQKDRIMAPLEKRLADLEAKAAAK